MANTDERATSRKPKIRGFYIGIGSYFIFSIVFALLLGKSPAQCLVDYVRFMNLRQELNTARELWDVNKPHRYQVRIGSLQFLEDGVPQECIRDTIVVFQDGVAVEGENFKLCEETYATVSIERIFEQIAQELSATNMFTANWELEFDPHYGYVSRFYVQCHSSGLISEQDCLKILPSQSDAQERSFPSKSFAFSQFLVQD